MNNTVCKDKITLLGWPGILVGADDVTAALDADYFAVHYAIRDYLAGAFKDPAKGLLGYVH